MDFRTRLREQIDYLDLTDKEVAARAGITKRALDSYVGARGCMPSADVAVKLARVLGVSADWLITGELNPPVDNDIQQLNNLYKKLSTHDKKVIIDLIKILNKESSK